MFDSYEPVPAISCVWCGEPVGEWQGKDSPCALLVWRQGIAEAVDQRVDEESKTPFEKLRVFRLPREFQFYGWCGGGHCTWVTGRTEDDGTWTESDLAVSLEAVEIERERRVMRDRGYRIAGAEPLDPKWWGPNSW